MGERGGGARWTATWKIVAACVALLVLVGAAFLWRPTPALKDGTGVAQPSSANAAVTSKEITPGSVVYYEQKVKPIFQANCYRCHGGMNHRGGLSMETAAGMMKGGKSGAVLVPGHPEESLLVKLMRHEGPRDHPMPMPPAPRPKISDAEIETVTDWIAAGAPMSAQEQ